MVFCVSKLCVSYLFNVALRFFCYGFEVNEGVEHKELPALGNYEL